MQVDLCGFDVPEPGGVDAAVHQPPAARVTQSVGGDPFSAEQRDSFSEAEAAFERDEW